MDLSNNLDSLEELLSYKFSKRELLKLSLTHRSFSQENNEIYEFLGDSIINLCASIWLMNKNKDLQLLHCKQGFPSDTDKQFNALAKILAEVVFPVPLGPQNK